MRARLVVIAACGALVACSAFSPDVGALRGADAGSATCPSTDDDGGYANAQPDDDDASVCVIEGGAPADAGHAADALYY